MRAIGYARLSRSTKESTSIDRQREEIARVAQTRGWDLAAVEVDDDVSATKTRLDRRGLDRVRARVAAGGIGAVIVWRLDRLGRSLLDIVTLTEEFSEHGATLVSASEDFDAGTPMGNAMLGIMAVFAAHEANVIRERVTASRKALRKVGRFPGGRVPYGYETAPHPEGAGRILIPNKDEAAVIRECADRILEDGETLYGLMTDLNDRGVKPRTAKRWSTQAIRFILTGDSVLGRVRESGDLIRDEHGMPMTVWEPILDLATVQRLRALLGERRADRPAPKARRHGGNLLSGILECSSCGANLRVNTRKAGPSYTCQTRSDGGECERPVSIVARTVDEWIEGEYLKRFGIFAHEEVEIIEADNAALADVNTAIGDLTAALLDASEEDEDEIMARLRALKRRREALRAEPAETKVIRRPTGKRIRDVWADAPLAARRDLLRGAIDTFRLLPGVRGRRGLDTARLDLTWRGEHGG